MREVPSTTYNTTLSRRVLQRTVKKRAKIYTARAQPVFFSLNLLFSEVPVAVSRCAFLKLPNNSTMRR